jgi:long-chain acyl-CoA synthetase
MVIMVGNSLAGDESYFGAEEAVHFYPAWMKWDIDIPLDETPIALFYESAEKFADQPCIDFKGKKLTYREVREAVDHAAVGLHDMGVKKGERVGIDMINTPYYPIMFLAIQRAGATVVSFSPADKDNIDVNRKIALESETTMMVTNDVKELYAVSQALRADGTLQKPTILCPIGDMLPFPLKQLYPLAKGKTIAQVGADENVIPFQNLIKNNGDIERRVPLSSIKPQDLALLQYTSGSTSGNKGSRKGAMLSHFNLAANVGQIKEMTEIRPDRPRLTGQIGQGVRELGALPYFHIYGVHVAMLLPMLTGAEVHISPDPRDMKGMIDTTVKKQIEIAPLLPKQIACITEVLHKEKQSPFYPLKKLFASLCQPKRLSEIAVISGGENLPMLVQDSFIKAMKGKKIFFQPGYGLSETSPILTFSAAGTNADRSSVGLPVPRTEIKLVDPDDKTKIVPWGEKGILHVRGAQVMQGYLKRSDLNAEKISSDRWFNTGDLAWFDEKGNVHIGGRNDRVKKVNGEKVDCSVIEQAIMQHPAVAECVAVETRRAKDDALAIKAFIVFKPEMEGGKPKNRDEWYEFLRSSERGTEQLNHVEVPYYIIEQKEPLLRTSTQKTDWMRIEENELAQCAAALVAKQQPSTPAL